MDIKQNTPEWLEWRSKGLGASDAPIILGVSPWTTRHQLFLQKVGLSSKPKANIFQTVAMERGHDLEPKVREMYERLTGYKFPAMSFTHERLSYLRCSLDGHNIELNRSIEIKCPGKVDHAKALDGRIPDKYYPQVQMQMIVSGAGLCDYVSWDGKSEMLVIIPVAADKAYQLYLLNEMITFWTMINDKHLVDSIRSLFPKPADPVTDGDGFTKVS